ncbi:Polyketide cyclase / dehydrase and lipid transport [Andreprevotia lacus DSM 23236]|jgi:hypothetical protein|uniref:Polyketide cyclase / dehydrase and lipid transport n=1 Tax=Andreprevotia lacus DSM 23236 TaxID=1121001 RepID=A0A1W1XUE2_9NEIS|nr:SRPBCC family protein [Andreprevotia lacus]SMC27507.1 Polyketide cyclase / dehydrase and lipid transport [Andreprevotia lacus DSM 23236]
MPVIDTRCSIAVPAAQAYAASQSHQHRRSWDPFTRCARYLHGAQREAAGVQVRITSWLGMQMEVAYVSVKPGERAAISMTRGPFFLQSFAGSWVFHPAGEHGCEARFRYHISAQPWLRWLEPLMLRYFHFETTRRLRALRRHCERP